MRTFEDLIMFLATLNALTARYEKHKINRAEYLFSFDKIVKRYEMKGRKPSYGKVCLN